MESQTKPQSSKGHVNMGLALVDFWQEILLELGNAEPLCLQVGGYLATVQWQICDETSFPAASAYSTHQKQYAATRHEP